MSDCRSCGAAVRWVETAAGKRMPLDPEPVDGGNVELRQVMLDRQRHTIAVVHPVGQPALDEQGPRYVSHFATCPNAAAHRHPRGARDG